MSLQDLNNQILKCEKCALSKTRINVVPGGGSANADIMFIGEGPGKNEDEQGVPFVGAALYGNSLLEDLKKDLQKIPIS